MLITIVVTKENRTLEPFVKKSRITSTKMHHEKFTKLESQLFVLEFFDAVGNVLIVCV